VAAITSVTPVRLACETVDFLAVLPELCDEIAGPVAHLVMMTALAL
jgi:hypothetical protein